MDNKEVKQDCCQTQLSIQQNQEMIFTMENLLMKNKILSKRMLEIINENDENGEKIMHMLKKLGMFSGNCSVKGEFILDENKNDTDIKESLVQSTFDENNEDENDSCNPPTEDDTPGTYLSLTGRLANIASYGLTDNLSYVAEKTGLTRVFGYFGTPALDQAEVEAGVEKNSIMGVHEQNNLEIRISETDQLLLKEEINRVHDIIIKKEGKVKAQEESFWIKKPIVKYIYDKVGGTKTTSDLEDLEKLSPKTDKPRIFIHDTEETYDTSKGLQITMSDSFKDSVLGSRLMIEPSDSFGDNIIKDLTPGYDNSIIETSTPLALDQGTGVFVFRDSKKAEDSKDVAEDVHAEQFEDNKMYLAQKIKKEELVSKTAPTTQPPLLTESNLEFLSSLELDGGRGSHLPVVSTEVLLTAGNESILSNIQEGENIHDIEEQPETEQGEGKTGSQSPKSQICWLGSGHSDTI